MNVATLSRKVLTTSSALHAKVLTLHGKALTRLTNAAAERVAATERNISAVNDALVSLKTVTLPEVKRDQALTNEAVAAERKLLGL